MRNRNGGTGSQQGTGVYAAVLPMARKIHGERIDSLSGYAAAKRLKRPVMRVCLSLFRINRVSSVVFPEWVGGLAGSSEEVGSR